MQNIVRINEQQLKQILSEAVQEVLTEIGHRASTLPIVTNIQANKELEKGNDVYIRPNGKLDSLKRKRGRSSEITYRLLNQGIIDNVGDGFILTFGREEPDSTFSNLTFKFQNLRLLTEKRFVIEGIAEMSRHPIPVGSKKPKKIQIDYIFDKQCFYEAVYCANGTVRDMRKLSLDHAGVDGLRNVQIAKKLIQFMTMCLYSIDDGKSKL